jgi:hypothetical protein
MSLILFDEVSLKRFAENFNTVSGILGEWAHEMSKVFQKWFPVVSEAQRAEAKRVHSMYRRKQKARRRRNRRR